MAVLSIKDFDESVYRGAKIAAVECGVHFRDYVTDALKWAIDSGFIPGSAPVRVLTPQEEEWANMK